MLRSLLMLAAAGTLVAGAAPAAYAQTEAELDDPTIVAIFDAANTYDIEASSLAAEKGSSEEVRAFGEQLVNDHTAVRQQGRDLAKKLGVTPTPPAENPLGEAHTQAMEKLRGLSGEEFDRAYLEHEVAYHQAVRDAISETLLPAIDNAEVRALVVKVAPAFEAHQMAAQRMLDDME